MKKCFLLCFIIISVQNIQAQNIGVNTTSPDTSAVLEVYATDKGFLMPRLSTIQMNAIYKPATGLAVYNTDSAGFCVYTGAAWVKIITSTNQNTGTNYFTASGNDIYSNNSGNVGIGTSSPSYKLEISGTAKADSLHASFLTLSGGAANGYILQSDSSGNGSWANADGMGALHYVGTSYLGKTSGYGGTGASEGTTGNLYNIFIGSSAGRYNTTGSYNTALGTYTLIDNTTGSYNTAIGTNALKFNTTGKYNNALGYAALANNSGEFNNAVGANALFYNGSVNDNNAFGDDALRNNTTGTSNTAMGNDVARNNIKGSYNAYLGAKAFYTNTSGSNNTGIGYQAGYNNTGSNNVFLGNNAGYYETGSNKLYIDNSNTTTPLIYGDFSAKKLTINDSLASKYFTMTHGAANGYVLQSDSSGNASWVAASGLAVSGDNLGNHTAGQNINLNGYYLSGNGTDYGLSIANDGNATVTSSSSTAQFSVGNSANSYSEIQFKTAGRNWKMNGYGDKFSIIDDAANASPLVIDKSSGNDVLHISGNYIGVNKSSPSHALDINGTAKADSINTSYFKLANGAANGYVLQSDSSGNARWVAASGLAVSGDNLGNHTAQQNINLNGYYLSGNGTDYGLSIANDGNATVTSSSSTAQFSVGNSGNTYSEIQFKTAGRTWKLNGYDDKFRIIDDAANASPLVIDKSSGNDVLHISGNYIGINKSSPSYALDINGAAKADSINTSYFKLSNGAANGYILQSDASGNAGWVSNTGGAISYIGTSYLGKTSGYGSTGTSEGTSSNLYNIGIGASVLNANTTGNNNVALGQNALGSNTTGTDIIAIGQNALKSNVGVNSYSTSVDIRYPDIAIGKDALKSNDYSVGNIAIGYQSQSNIINGNVTSGFLNTSIGTLSLYSGTTGNSNAAIGYKALYANTTGSGNTAMGYGTGLTNTTGNNNTFLGTNADAGSSSLTNATAIGYAAVVGSSNSLVLGGTGTYAVNVGIGTTTPSQTLDISGTTKTTKFQMTNGAANGYVLQSDASGNASWVSASAVYGSGWTTNGNNIYNINSGYVGIGTTSPSYKLQVSGTAKADSINTSYFKMSNGAASGYVLQSDGSGNASWVSSSSLSNSNWTTNGNNLYSALSGNVGIGTSSPSYKLHVSGTAKADSINTSYFKMTNGAASGYILQSDDSGNASWVSSSVSGDNFGNHTAQQNIQLKGYYLSRDGDNYGLSLDYDGNATVTSSSSTTQLSVGSSNNSYSEIHFIAAGRTWKLNGYNDKFRIIEEATNASPLVIDKLSGNDVLHISGNYIGINKSFPSYALDINGAAKADSIYTSYFKMTNGAASGYILQSDASGNAGWVSNTSGAVSYVGTSYLGKTSGYGSTGSSEGTSSNLYNIGVGASVLNANTTGNNNIALGQNALSSNTTGTGVIAIGQNALKNSKYIDNSVNGYYAYPDIAVGKDALTTASTNGGNVAIGYQSQSKSDSYLNTSIGALSLYANTTGIVNTAIGARAGATNTTGYDNTFIGSEADASSGSLYNATAIGYAAKVASSNSLVLGGTGTYAVNVGIGTTSPSQTLDVSGTTKTTKFQMTNGAASGYILQSDGSGNASWVSNTGGAISYIGTSYLGKTSGYGSTGSSEGTSSNLYNIGIGASVLNANTTGNNNIALGQNALSSNTTGTGVIAIGQNALKNSKQINSSYSPYPDIAIGGDALKTTSYNSGNVAIGYQSQANVSANGSISGTGNTSIGTLSLYSNADYYNTAVGYKALYANEGGSNTAIGNEAGLSNTSGYTNTFIGAYADAGSGSLSNATAIGYAAKVSSSNSIVLGGTGSYAVKVGIGTSSPSQTLDVSGTTKTTKFQMTNGAVNGYVLQSDADGNASWVSAGTAYGTGWTTSGSNIYNNNSGNVGIGTSSPGYPLHVSGSGMVMQQIASSNTAGTWLAVNNSSTGGTTWNMVSTGAANGEGAGNLLIRDNSTVRMTVKSATGYVGIGTTSPSYKLHVSGTAKADSINTSYFKMTNGAASGYVLQSDGSGNASWASASTVYGYSAGWTTSGSNIYNNNSGNVGIGTSSPNYPLHVSGSGTVMQQIESSNTMGTWLALNNSSTGGGTWNIISTGSDNGETAGNLLIRDNSTVRMALKTGSGYVGIGTTSPSSTLHVNGSISVKRTAYSSSNVISSTDHIVAVTTSSAVTLTLPNAATEGSGREYIIKSETSSASITISTIASQTIDGAASKSITTGYGVVRLYSDGSNWFTY